MEQPGHLAFTPILGLALAQVLQQVFIAPVLTLGPGDALLPNRGHGRQAKRAQQHRQSFSRHRPPPVPGSTTHHTSATPAATRSLRPAAWAAAVKCAATPRHSRPDRAGSGNRPTSPRFRLLPPSLPILGAPN